MTFIKQAVLILSALLIASCDVSTNRSQAEAVEHDVPLFISTVKALDESTADNAFEELNSALKYALIEPPASPNTYQAASRIGTGGVFDGVLTLMVTRPSAEQPPSQFGAALSVSGDTASHAFEQKVKQLLGRESYSDTEGNPVWELKNKRLRLNGPNAVLYENTIIKQGQ